MKYAYTNIKKNKLLSRSQFWENFSWNYFFEKKAKKPWYMH